MKQFKKASDIRVGVIGYGGAFNMGRNHLKEMEEAGMTPTAVCEVDAERLKVAESDFPGIQTYSTLAGMLRTSDVDLVTIITPHNTHAKLARQCLRAGKHVIVEKPLAITTAECNAMIADAKKSSVVLSTYHNRHWDGWILTALEKVKKDQAIGKVYKIDARMGRRECPRDWWRTSRTISGGALYDWGVHLLEYGLQIADSEITEVSGYAHRGYWAPHTKWKADTNEDEAAAVVRFRNGIWMNLAITSLDSNTKPGFFEITGTEGSYAIHPTHYTLTRRNGLELQVEEGPHAANQWHRFYENIAAHLVRGTKLIITPEWSRRPIHVLDLAVRSAQLGHALPSRYR